MDTKKQTILDEIFDNGLDGFIDITHISDLGEIQIIINTDNEEFAEWLSEDTNRYKLVDNSDGLYTFSLMCAFEFLYYHLLPLNGRKLEMKYTIIS